MHIEQLVPSDIDWESAYGELVQAIEKHGVERLKPLFEETGERYDYNIIRLARVYYQLK